MSSFRTDRYASAGVIVLFSFALGIANVALPLRALDAGYTAAQIGVLTAVSAVAQLAVRTTVPALTRRLSDRAVVATAVTLLAASCGVIALSTTITAFVVSELLQGAARGYFWSGSQLHAVRTRSSPLRGIAFVNLMSSVGLVAGPMVAGVLADELDVALGVAAGVAGVGTLAAMSMSRLGALPARERSGAPAVWRQPQVIRSSTASAGAGVWSALMVSYVPVVLAAEQPGAVVGVLVAVANGCNILGSVLVAGLPPASLNRWMALGAVANGLGLAVVAPAAASVLAATVLLAVSGLGSGALLTLGPARATAAVGEHERASAIAVTGSARAAAMLLAPLAVAAAVTAVPLAAALGGVGVLLALPGASFRRTS